MNLIVFFFSSRRRHTRLQGDWSSDVCSSDLKKVSFYTVDAMRVVDGKITEHWGVATLLDLMQQLGVVPPLGRQRERHRSPNGSPGRPRLLRWLESVRARASFQGGD